MDDRSIDRTVRHEYMGSYRVEASFTYGADTDWALAGDSLGTLAVLNTERSRDGLDSVE